MSPNQKEVRGCMAFWEKRVARGGAGGEGWRQQEWVADPLHLQWGSDGKVGGQARGARGRRVQPSEDGAPSPSVAGITGFIVRRYFFLLLDSLMTDIRQVASQNLSAGTHVGKKKGRRGFCGQTSLRVTACCNLHTAPSNTARN